MLWAFQKKHRNLVSDFNRKNITDASTKSKSFFTREDVSRVTTDRKQTITRNMWTQQETSTKMSSENTARMLYSSFSV